MGPSKGKKPQKAPTGGSSQGASKDKQPQKPSSQQPSKEASVQGSSKESKKLQTPSSQQPSKEASVQGSSKESKKPQTPSSLQPSTKESTQASSKGKQAIPSPLAQQPQIDIPIHAVSEVKRSPVEQQPQPSTKGKQREDPLPKQPPLSEKAKGKQPVSKPVYGNPKCYILRIPVERTAPMKRVKVSIGPDTAYRHPQTFFFKNIPCLESFWGYTNDAAFTATRIVRMMKELKPTPYFLMVCIGEYPKVKSPRNKNGVFMGMDEPVFGDAFVFKLGEPELYGEGYSRYVHFEEDFHKIDWLPKAIMGAARKVETAMAEHANPGFPNLKNYADEQTMLKDTEKMKRWMARIEKVKEKYATPFPVDKKSGLPDLERMHDILYKMSVDGFSWKDDRLLRIHEGSDKSGLPTAEAYVERILEFDKAYGEAIPAYHLEVTSSASTETGSPSTKTKELVERAKECFLAAKSAFEPMEAIVRAEAVQRGRDAFDITDPEAEIDWRALSYMANLILTSVIAWKKEHTYIASKEIAALYQKTIEELSTKLQAFCKTIEDGVSNNGQIVEAVIELKELYQSLDTGGVELRASREAKAAGANAASEADEDKIPILGVMQVQFASGRTGHIFKHVYTAQS